MPASDNNEMRDRLRRLPLAEKQGDVRELVRELAIPLYDPRDFFDDRDDEEADMAYTESAGD